MKKMIVLFSTNNENHPHSRHELSKKEKDWLGPHQKFIDLLTSTHRRTLIFWQARDNLSHHVAREMEVSLKKCGYLQIKTEALFKIEGIGQCVSHYNSPKHPESHKGKVDLVICCVSPNIPFQDSKLFYSKLLEYWNRHCLNFSMEEIPEVDDPAGSRLTIDFRAGKCRWELLDNADDLEDTIVAL